ncbi:hypothetical protein OIU77_011555 [Salix suchowensis]|uniref:Uncharacterized protein n=1 Tax=Salix suchowensis TaxID=1278906 RepID=A0ABQ9A1Q3_9ROSI|nr:hypothetical protein OIU77_011555 [Salix suchowensis]
MIQYGRQCWPGSKQEKRFWGDFSFANPEDPKSGDFASLLGRCIVNCRFEGREAIFIRESKKCRHCSISIRF